MQPGQSLEPNEHDKIDGASSAGPARGRAEDLTSIEHVRASCRALVVFGMWAAWGFVALGVLSGGGHLLESARGDFWNPSGAASAVLRAASRTLAFVLAGSGIWALSQLTALSIAAYLQRLSVLSGELSTQANRGLALLERIADTLEIRASTAASSPAAGLERSRSMAEILRAARAADWVEAEMRLGQFEVEFPDDPELGSLKEELAKARAGSTKEGLARLEAAREANDADRILEIYPDVVRSLDDTQRAPLASDLAKWFLSLIHRRLRSGKVQADVVQLAARFAEMFAATVEGASVRASLPTLRRSVGLCPRCAQPYRGVAEACPQCLKAASGALSSVASNTETQEPE
jgi:hypothetical protein